MRSSQNARKSQTERVPRLLSKAFQWFTRNYKTNKKQRSRRPVEREAKTVADRRTYALLVYSLYHRERSPVNIDRDFSYKQMTQKET